MEYNFSGKITLTDYIQFNKYYYRKMEIIWYLLVFICIIVNLAFNLKKYFDTKRYYSESINQMKNLAEDNNVYFDELVNNSSNLNLFFEVFFSIIIFIFFFILFSLIIKKIISPMIYKKYYNSNKMFNELQNYSITNEKITISSESGNVIIIKEKILKILNDKNSIYIYVGLNMAYIIKRHFFENNETFDELLMFIKEKYK